MKKPLLIIFVGVPGSGKTTISKRLCEEDDFCRVSTDEIKVYFENKLELYNIKKLYSYQKKNL